MVWSIMVFVTKFDSSVELYSREKVVKTCLKMGVSRDEAENVADHVERSLYDGISTKEIHRIIIGRLKRYRPEIAYRRDLRTAISLLRPKPDWELFVRMLMAKDGYRVDGNMLLKGKCVENEVDGVLYKGSEVILLEVKHHSNPHTKTSLDIPREARSIFEDIVEGYELGYHNMKPTETLIVCNTKLTDRAIQYADCRGIRFISWKHPPNHGLENLIEKHSLYPTALLQEVSENIEAALGDTGIVSLEQLVATDLSHLARKSGIDKTKLQGLINRMKQLF